MAAADWNIRIERGASFRLECRYRDGDGDPVNMTGFDVRASVKPGTRRNGRNFVEAGEPLLVFDTTITEPAGGVFLISATAEDTADLDFDTAVWDCVIESADGTITRLIEGAAQLAQEVTA